MARPPKIGFSYFPFDVDFFEDLKIKKIRMRCGTIGQLTIIYIYSLIYKDKGYYLKLDEDTTFIIGEKMGITEEAVDSIIQEAVNVGIFDKKLKEYHLILTSKGILKRYQHMRTQNKRIDIIENDNLFHTVETALREEKKEETQITSVDNPIHSVDNEVTTVHNTTNKTKQNKTKVKESKGNKAQKFSKPTIEEIKLYIQEKQYSIDAEHFYYYYEGNGWRVGRNPMKSWQATIESWQRRNQSSQTKGNTNRENGKQVVRDIMEELNTIDEWNLEN